ncbi:MAG: DNA topoisomerase IB, partial [Pirellulaceae bacterium]
AHKYDRLIEFAAVLPAIRRQVTRHLRLPGMPREKIVALIVRLLEVTLIRIGNEEYARQNGSFGLTTLKDQHAVVRRDQVRFSFRGKSGKLHDVSLQDARLARLVHQCRELPGYRLFQYLDEQGVPQEVGSGQVNEYLRTVTGREFTAKDFRTWFGTVIAAQELLAQPAPSSQRARKAAVVQAIQRTAERLGNTVAVCRKCYIHPAVTNAFLQDTLRTFFPEAHPGRSRSWWESATLRFLSRKGPEFRQAS